MAVQSSSRGKVVGPQAYIFTLSQLKVSIRCGQQFWSRLMTCGFVTWHRYASSQQLYTFLRGNRVAQTKLQVDDSCYEVSHAGCLSIDESHFTPPPLALSLLPLWSIKPLLLHMAAAFVCL